MVIDAGKIKMKINGAVNLLGVAYDRIYEYDPKYEIINKNAEVDSNKINLIFSDSLLYCKNNPLKPNINKDAITMSF